MAQQLTDMSIDEISLVDDPANEQARVLIVKAKGGKKAAAKSLEIEITEEDESTSGEESTTADGMEDEDEKTKRLMARVKKAIEGIAPRVAQTLAGSPSADNDAANTAAASLKEYVMDIETLSKSLEEAEAKLAALAKRADDAEAALKDAGEVIKAKEAEIETLTKSAEPAAEPVAEEDVLKSLPESIRKRLEESEKVAKAAQAEIAKMRDESERAEAIAKAKELKVGDPDVVGPLLLRVAKGMSTAEDAAALTALLKGAGEVADQSALFKSVGSDAAVDGEPEELLKAKAAEIQKVNTGMTFEQAYVKAMEENPSLYNAYVSKSKRRAA